MNQPPQQSSFWGEGLNPDDAIGKLQVAFRWASVRMLTNDLDVYQATWRRFIGTYRFRRNFRWLVERQAPPAEGLKNAVKTALQTYNVPRTPATKDGTESSGQRQWHTFRPLRGSDREMLTSVMHEVASDNGDMADFAHKLQQAGVNVASLSSEDVCGHLVAALEQYHTRRMDGTDGE